MNQKNDEIAYAKKQNTRYKIYSAVFMPVLKTSPEIDKFASWLLAGCGATVSLIISNLKPLSTVMDINTIKISLGILALAGIFGFLEKYYSTIIKINTDIKGNMEPMLTNAINNHSKFENDLRESGVEGNISLFWEYFEEAINTLADLSPWWLKKSLKKDWETSIKDPTYLFKKFTKILNLQIYSAIVEFFSFLFFVVFVIYNL